MNIELHVFTNSTINAPSTKIIEETIESFVRVFGNNVPATVWCDPNPNTERSQEYIENLKKLFSIVHLTDSLADGYIKAVENSISEYLFMLEHDWKISKTIKHSLSQIIEDMESHDLWYLLFNKFNNFDQTPHGPGDVVRGRHISFYKWNRISNNPHIINRIKYKEKALKYIDTNCKGALGIEEKLTRCPLVGAVYGSIETPATVYHLNGRSQKK